MTVPSLCDSPALQHHWYAVAAEADIGEGPVAVRLLGERYVLWRTSPTDLVVAPDRCPHRQAKLSDGSVDQGVLSCPYHGWAFGEHGRCQAVPSSGAGTPIPPRAHLATVATRVRYGLVWLCPGEPVADVPDVWEDGDPNYRRINTGVQVWECAVTRMVDNFLDYAHFAFVHRDSIGKDLDPRVGPMSIEEIDDGFVGYRFTHTLQAGPEGDPGRTEWMTTSTGFHLPFLIRGSMTRENGVRNALMLVSTPVDDVTSYFTFVIWSNEMEAPVAELTAFELNIDAEDQRMLESLEGPLPLDPLTLVNVQSDKASVEWRRQLLRMLQAEPAAEPVG
jgi:phenylpropionate dioxygenase-like ring-hydroxylating dioxygenase large terminal subunit